MEEIHNNILELFLGILQQLNLEIQIWFLLDQLNVSGFIFTVMRNKPRMLKCLFQPAAIHLFIGIIIFDYKEFEPKTISFNNFFQGILMVNEKCHVFFLSKGSASFGKLEENKLFSSFWKKELHLPMYPLIQIYLILVLFSI